MTKPVLPSISKRTRSKIKQTTLLDYKVPANQRRATTTTVETRDLSPDASALVAAASVPVSAAVESSSNDATKESRRMSSSSRPMTDNPPCQETSKRATTRAKSTIVVVAAPIDNNPCSRNGRIRFANAGTTASIASTTNSKETVTVAMTKRQANDAPPCDDPTNATRNKREKRGKDNEIFNDVIWDTNNAPTMVKRLTRQQLQQQQEQQQHTLESVTPSPDSIVNNDDIVVSETSRRSSSNNIVVMKSGSTESSSSDGTNVDCSTPLKATGQGTKVDCDVNFQVELNPTDNRSGESESPPPLLLHPSVVTVDRLETLQTRRRQPITDELPPTKGPVIPTFHQPWQQPYQPVLFSNESMISLPLGVIDIDAIPHACCLHSYQAHEGYSWISSRKRCGCAIDSNHNSSESMTEAYLGSYGVNRYGTVGLAFATVNDAVAEIGRKTLNEGEWNTEQWWLDQTRQGIEAKVSSGTSLSNNKISSNARTGRPLSVSRSTTSSRVRASILPCTVERHIDYMPRQPYITVDMRRTLMDWLLEVAEEYKLSSETFWLSVTLVDRSLACSYGGEKGSDTMSKCIIGKEMLVPTENIQLVGW
jgi:hypothetical protein